MLSSQSSRQRNLEKVLVEGVDYVSTRNQQHFAKYGSMINYQVNAQVLSGVVSVDHELGVWDVQCDLTSSQQLSHVIIDFADGTFSARKWVPGTRLVIGASGWSCMNNNDDTPMVYLVMSREILRRSGNMIRVQFEVRRLQYNEVFLNANVKMKSKPISVPSCATPTPFQMAQQSFSRAVNWQFSKDMSMWSFNQNTQTLKVIEPSIVLYNNINGVQLVCEDCYASLRAEVSVDISFSWWSLSLNQGKVTFGGNWKSYTMLKASVTREREDSFEKEIWKSPTPYTVFIPVLGFPIPIRFTLKLGVEASFKASGTLEYSRDFTVTYQRTIGVGYDSTKSLEKSYVIDSGNSYSLESTTPGVRLSANAELQLALVPSVEVTVFSLALGSVGVKPSLKVGLSGEGLLSTQSASLFVKLHTSFSLAVILKAFSYSKTLDIYSDVPIPYLSYTYAVQSASFKAVNAPSQQQQDPNLIPTLPYSSVTVGGLEVTVTIQGVNNNYYFLKYRDIRSSSYSTTASKICKYGCTYTIYTPANTYYYFEVVNDGYLYNEVKETTTVSLYVSTTSGTLYSGNYMSIEFSATDPTYTFTSTPNAPISLNYGQTHFEYNVYPQFPYYFVSFASSTRLTSNLISGSPVEFYENGAYTYLIYSNKFTIFTATTLNFKQVLNYRLMKDGEEFKEQVIYEKDHPFGFAINNAPSETMYPNYMISARIRGQFNVMIFEGSIERFSFKQTKGKKYTYEGASLNTTITYNWNFTRPAVNSTGIRTFMVQFLPTSTMFTLENFRIDSYSQIDITSQSSYSARNLVLYDIGVRDATTFINPYLMVVPPPFSLASIRVGTVIPDVLFAASATDGITIYNVTTSNTKIPISMTKLPLTIASTNDVTAEFVPNYKIISGVPSITATLRSFFEKAYYAYKCETPMAFSPSDTLFLRVIDITTSKPATFYVVVEIFLMNSKGSVIKSGSLEPQGNGLFTLSRTESLASLCQESGNYIQFKVYTIDGGTIYLELSVVNTISLQNKARRNVQGTTMTLDPSKGQLFLNIEQTMKQEKTSKSGIVLKAAASQCNLALYINSANSLAPPSFLDKNSIYDFRAGMNGNGESLPISFLKSNSAGSVVLAYTDTQCSNVDFSYEELKNTDLTLHFIDPDAKTSESISTLLNISSIQIKINSPYHSWDKTFIQELRNNLNTKIFEYLKVNTSFTNVPSLQSLLNITAMGSIDSQTVEIVFSVKAEATSSNVQLIGGLYFRSFPSMFDTGYDIKPRNSLTFTDSKAVVNHAFAIHNFSSPWMGLMSFLFLYFVIWH
ncbi:hypothetical protein C9374_006138 [Naegleria lovaniensis]|uniref:Uncharacterized protein n=1 Tax=Naegleria lovaniensis TaxID=51637 RepID=A0AA88KHG4_NAELO|nr:uncharacterized protein C9374_006138 [Naegleria lovaniensis]KAG2381754.1 hypothetical protein C9374_006138 [Naegleria lovaniensis]